MTGIDAVSRRLIALSLEEDLGPGDVTTVLVPPDSMGRARILAKQNLVLAGVEAFEEVYRQVDPEVQCHWERHDGDILNKGEIAGHVAGSSRSLLIGERLALNLLQRLCGVATMARQAADAVAGTKCKVVDTRKTTPGMRTLQKAAVRAGGAHNHRFGLFDGILVKDNHIAAAGGITAAIKDVRAANHHLLKVECETTTLDEVQEALTAGADIILLDNMDDAMLKKAVELIDGRAIAEASGNVTVDRLPRIAATGVDIVSMGALTHSAIAADISLGWDQ